MHANENRTLVFTARLDGSRRAELELRRARGRVAIQTAPLDVLCRATFHDVVPKAACDDGRTPPPPACPHRAERGMSGGERR